MVFGTLARRMLPRAALLASVLSLFTTVVLALPVIALFQEVSEPQPLTGVYTVTVTRRDVPPNLSGGPALVGLWNITFNGDGTYTLARQDVGEVVSGTFEAAEATLSFNSWSGIVGCVIEEGGDPATYAWRIEDDALTLTPITDSCTERLTLLTTRSLGGFEACVTEPRQLADPFGGDIDSMAVFGTPVAEPSPRATGVAAQEGLSEGADAEEAIDRLLQQANGCWATGDPTRFLALHSNRVVQEIAFVGPLEDFARQLRLFMATPLVFERIGPVNLIDPDHAWAYVEVTLGGEPIPQRMDFVFEDGAWLLDTFFLFSAAPPAPPVEVGP